MHPTSRSCSRLLLLSMKKARMTMIPGLRARMLMRVRSRRRLSSSKRSLRMRTLRPPTLRSPSRKQSSRFHAMRQLTTRAMTGTSSTRLMRMSSMTSTRTRSSRPLPRDSKSRRQLPVCRSWRPRQRLLCSAIKRSSATCPQQSAQGTAKPHRRRPALRFLSSSRPLRRS